MAASSWRGYEDRMARKGVPARHPGVDWPCVTHRSRGLAGDLWGGLASMLVALPASLAFGVAIYAPLGPSHAGQGVLGGVLGATTIGIVAPFLGGTERLVSAPCAPAAAVMGALALALAGPASSSGS